MDGKKILFEMINQDITFDDVIDFLKFDHKLTRFFIDKNNIEINKFTYKIYDKDISFIINNPDLNWNWKFITQKQIENYRYNEECLIFDYPDLPWDVSTVSYIYDMHGGIRLKNIDELVYRFPDWKWRFILLFYKSTLPLEYILKYYDDENLKSYDIDIKRVENELTPELLRKYPQLFGDVLDQMIELPNIPIEYIKRNFKKKWNIKMLANKLPWDYILSHRGIWRYDYNILFDKAAENNNKDDPDCIKYHYTESMYRKHLRTLNNNNNNQQKSKRQKMTSREEYLDSVDSTEIFCQLITKDLNKFFEKYCKKIEAFKKNFKYFVLFSEHIKFTAFYVNQIENYLEIYGLEFIETFKKKLPRDKHFWNLLSEFIGRRICRNINAGNINNDEIKFLYENLKSRWNWIQLLNSVYGISTAYNYYHRTDIKYIVDVDGLTETIKQYPNIPWDSNNLFPMKYILENKPSFIEYMIEHNKVNEINKFNFKLTENERLNGKFDFISEEYFEKYPELLEIIDAKNLSSNIGRNISIDFVKKHKELNWSWFLLIKNLDWDFILDNIELFKPDGRWLLKNICKKDNEQKFVEAYIRWNAKKEIINFNIGDPFIKEIIVHYL